MADVQRIIWLTGESDAAVREHLLLGDQIQLDGKWFSPTAVGSVSGRSVLMLRYGSVAGIVGFCMPATPSLGVERILACRALVSLETASRIWIPFAERLGYAQEDKPDTPLWCEQNVLWGARSISIRRPKHPNFLVDRLMQRERDLASSRMSHAAESLAELRL